MEVSQVWPHSHSPGSELWTIWARCSIHTRGHTSHCSCTKFCYLQGYSHVIFMVAETSITSPTWAHSRLARDLKVIRHVATPGRASHSLSVSQPVPWLQGEGVSRPLCMTPPEGGHRAAQSRLCLWRSRAEGVRMVTCCRLQAALPRAQAMCKAGGHTRTLPLQRGGLQRKKGGAGSGARTHKQTSRGYRGSGESPATG